MAKAKGDVNRSQAIREYLQANPETKAKAVVEALATGGVSVNEGLVYAVKGALKEKKQRKARVMNAAKKASATNGAVNKSDAIALILDVKALAAKAGGYETLKELVDALAM